MQTLRQVKQPNTSRLSLYDTSSSTRSISLITNLICIILTIEGLDRGTPAVPSEAKAPTISRLNVNLHLFSLPLFTLISDRRPSLASIWSR